MSPLLPQFNGLRRLAFAAFSIWFLLCLAAVGGGVYLFAAAPGSELVGIALIAMGVAGAALGVLSHCQSLLAMKLASNGTRTYEALFDLSELIRRQTEYARTISENSSMSEWAKRVIYREKDYEFLRDTVQAAIARQDWETAEHLIRDMAEQFGYRDEAAYYRDQLDQSRRASEEERVAAAVARVEQLCNQRKWEQARRESEKMRSLFNQNERIRMLVSDVEHRRQEFKRHLLREYDQAVKVNDIDAAHRLLHDLDLVLATNEADSLRESARNVFRAKLEQLRTQFSVAVSYKQFNGAIEIAESLIREFPNSGYAQELSKLMPVLRARAAKEMAAHGAPLAG